MIVGFLAEIWTRSLSNTKQECYTLYPYVCSLISKCHISAYGTDYPSIVALVYKFVRKRPGLIHADIRAVIFWWTSPAQSFFVSGPVGTHDHLFIRSKTTYVIWNVASSSKRGVWLILSTYWLLCTYIGTNLTYRALINSLAAVMEPEVTNWLLLHRMDRRDVSNSFSLVERHFGIL
jgi:hypothetical protein